MKEVNLIKIWSDSITDTNAKKMLDDIEKQYKKTWEQSIVISSWSVVLAKKYLWWERASKMSKSALSTIWQIQLMHMYTKQSNKVVAQLLLDDYVNRDYVDNKMEQIDIPNQYVTFARKVAYNILDLVHKNKNLHLLRVLEEHVRNDVLAILNHNDGMSSVELSALTLHADNDQNTVFISEIVNKYKKEISFRIKRVIFLTNTCWILDENWETVLWWEIETNKSDMYEKKYRGYVHNWGSTWWTGWMWSKISSGIKCLKYGVDEVIIANATEGLDCISHRENSTIFTWSILWEKERERELI